MSGIIKGLNKTSELLSAEWLLYWMPNGGGAVFYRSLFITVITYSVAIGILSSTGENSSFSFSWNQLLVEIHQTVPWIGAIFSGAYIALYARFSSQWSYLTDLYNQQMAVALTLEESHFEGGSIKSESYARWQAAFVEDAICMHLATKQGISNLIYDLLNDENVRQNLDEEIGGTNVSSLIEKLEKLKGGRIPLEAP